MPAWLQNNIRLVFILVFFSFAFLNWLFKQLKAQNDKRRTLAQKRTIELENLRTGGRFDAGASPGATSQAPPPLGTPNPIAAPRPSPAPAQAPSARESLEEIAARRRARMIELRAQQGARGAGQPGAPSSTPPAPPREDPTARVLGQILGFPTATPRAPSQTNTPAPRAPMPAPAQPGRAVPPAVAARQRAAARIAARIQQRSAARPAPRETQAPPAAPQAPIPPARQARPRVAAPTLTTNFSSGPQSASALSAIQRGPAHERGHQVSRQHEQPAGVVLAGRRFSSTDLRQLFAMREIIERPLALRDERDA